MKKLIVLHCLLSVCGFSRTFICSSDISQTPHDTFIINVSEKISSIKYERHRFFGSEEMSLVRDVPGCGAIKSTLFSKTSIYLECEGDGDSGFLEILMDGQNIAGVIIFPEGNIGYVDDTLLDLSCRESK
mgnify:CR=1 FL=1